PPLPPRPTVPPTAGGGTGGADSRVSVSMTSQPATWTGHGRRVSCTVALAVAGAVVAVTLGTGVLGDLLPGHDDGGTASPGPSATGTVTALPGTFVGTWSGPTTERGGLPHGTLTAVFTEGKKGEDVVRIRQKLTVLGTTLVCESVGRLVSGTPKELRIRERAVPGKTDAAMCTGEEADLTFTLVSDRAIGYRSDEEAAGLPKGTLARSGG
ncbi:MAG TPA: serine/threonine protein kinase, partial [Streptomyces sp.]